VSKTKQADGEIHEDQLLNFLVNRLDEEVSLSLANNAEITAEDIIEVLVGACADGDLCLYALCVEPELTRWEHGPLPSSTKFEPERLERVANTPLRKDPMNCSPNRWRSAQTSTCGPTTVTKTTQTALITGSEAWNHCVPRLATLYARVKNKRWRAGGTPSQRRR